MRNMCAVLAGVVLTLCFNTNAAESLLLDEAFPTISEEVAEAAPDSIVQLTAEAQGLKLVSPDYLPRSATFWLITSNGLPPAPYPCLPGENPFFPVFSIGPGQYLVDGSEGLVQLKSRPAKFQASNAAVDTVETALERLAGTVVNLISWIRESQLAQKMAVTLGFDSLDSGSARSANGVTEYSLTAADFGTNIWIAQVAVTNGYLTGIASNTQADVQYEIQSRINLAQTDWQTEGFFSGSELTNWTPFSVWQNTRNNLFIRLRSWIDSYNIGIPDWWQFQYFGTNGIDPYASAAGDGYDNLDKFELGLNPTNYYNPNAMTGFFGGLDATGTNVILYWQPAPGPVVNYAIQRGILNTNTSTFAYAQVGLVNSNATFFKDAGAVNNANAQNDIYNLTAVYPGGSGSATNTWNVWWYARYASHGPPYGPPVPGNLWANADVTGTNVMLSWLSASSAATNYLIFRGRFNPTNFAYQYVQITNVSPGTTNLAVFGALTNNSHWTEAYEVQAVYPGGGLSAPITTLPGYSSFSSIHTGANTNGPAAPGNFYGYPDATGTNLLLTWNPVAGAVTNYLIYGGVFDDTTRLIVYHQLAKLGATINSFAVVGGIDNNLYSSYEVVAAYPNGSLSQSAAWYPGDGAPAPSSLYAYLDATGTNVQLTWNAATGAITGYLVQRSDYGQNAWNYFEVGQVDANTTLLTDVDAVDTGDYDPAYTSYRVQATYPNGVLSPAVTAMVSDTPPAPTTLTTTIDASGTNVYLTWTPASGATGYRIEQGVFNQATGRYDYSQIAQVGSQVNAYNVVGAISNRNSTRNSYRVRATFADGSVSAPISSQLVPPAASPANLSVSAQLIRNQTGHWQVVFSGIPTNTPTLLLDLCYYDYFYDSGPTSSQGWGMIFPFDDWVFQEVEIPVSTLTNGIYVVPDVITTNLIGDNSYGLMAYVRVLDANGQIGEPAQAGFLTYDAPCFVDGSRHLKQNLLFELRAATVSQPCQSLTESKVWFDPLWQTVSVPADTNYVESSFFHWSYQYKGYVDGFGGYPYMKMDNLWPFTANYELHNRLYDTNSDNVLSDFIWQTNLVTIPAPAVLDVGTSYWISQLSGLNSGGIDPATGLPMQAWITADLADLGASTNNGNLYLQSGAHNLFGLLFGTALVKVNVTSYMDWIDDEWVYYNVYGTPTTVAPGGSTGLTNVSCFYSQTANPNLQLAGYYFAPVNTPGTALPGSPSSQLAPLPSYTGFANTNQTGLMVASIGTPTVIGGWAKFSIQNGYASKAAYLGQYFTTNAFLLNTNGTVSTNQTGIVSPYGDFFPTEPGAVAMVTMPDIDSEVQGTGVVRVIALNADANHDGVMEFKYHSPDFVSASKPFRFWANDNQDSGDYGGNDGIPGYLPAYLQDGLYVSTGLIPALTPTGLSSGFFYRVHGRRDLVDYFPVYLNIGSLFLSNVLSAGISVTDTNYQFVLSHADGTLRFVYTDLTPTNYMDYLRDVNKSGQLAMETAWPISATGIPLNNVFFSRFLSNIATNNQGIILVEAAAPTTQPLVLTIYRGTNQIAQTSLPLSITGVEQMFRSKTMMLNSTNGVVPDRLTDASVPNEPDTVAKNFVFVHGYNVLPNEARGTAADVFKRMYWSGSHAKFWAVTWEGADSKGSPPFYNKLTPNYHTNVVNAFLTAPNLATFIASLTNTGPVTLAAHSLGNMVTLSAINDWDAPISQYFMLDAAVAIEAIDPTSSNTNMIPSFWQSYSNRVFASKWYQLFPTNDYRSTLNWNNRFGDLHNVDVYNYYSSGEEVLRTYAPDSPTGGWAILETQLANAWPGGVPFGGYSWVWQEKGKGTCTEDWLIGSSHGGWRFPVNSYGDPNPVPPATANSLSNAVLQTTPVFTFGSYFDSVAGPHPDLALTNASGSAYAAANRNRILANAIPALSLPLAANPVTILNQPGQTHNFDMMTLETGWPQGRLTSGEKNNNWYHSDYHVIAYTFTHKLFDQFVTTGNLK